MLVTLDVVFLYGIGQYNRYLVSTLDTDGLVL